MTAPLQERRRPSSARHRLAAALLAALLLGAALLGGTGTLGQETEARWTAATGADGSFAAMTLGSVQNYRCTGGFWSSATVSWQRPAGVPDAAVSYRVTLQRAGTSQTVTQTATTYEYGRPAFNFDDVTITVQPVVGQWRGPSRSMTLDAVALVGMVCPS